MQFTFWLFNVRHCAFYNKITGDKCFPPFNSKPVEPVVYIDIQAYCVLQSKSKSKEGSQTPEQSE